MSERDRIRDLEARIAAQQGLIDELTQGTVTLLTPAPLRDDPADAPDDGRAFDFDCRKYCSVDEDYRFLRDVLDALDVQMCVLDHCGVIIETNRAWREFAWTRHGDAAAMGVGKKFTDVCCPCGAVQLNCAMQLFDAVERVIRGELSSYIADTPCFSADQKHWYQIHVRRIAGSARCAAIVYHQDITEQVQTHEQLKAKSDETQMLALVAKYTDNGVVITNADGEIEWVNEAFTNIHGYTLEEVRHRRPFELFSGPQTDPQTTRYIQDCMKAGRGFDVEIVHYRKNGEKFWKALEVRPIFNEAGRLTHWLAIQSDITEKKNFERRLRKAKDQAEQLALALEDERTLLENIFSAIPHGVFWKDRGGRYLGCNKIFARAAGYDDPRELLGKTDEDMPWKGTHAAWYRKCDVQVMESGRPMLDIEEPLTTNDGRELILLTSKVPLHGKDGAISGVLGTFAEITAYKNLEHELAQARRLEAIGQLAAGIAHEINTPVQFVSDNTHYLKNTIAALIPGLRRIQEIIRAADGAEVSAEQLCTARAVLDELELDFISGDLPLAIEQSLEGLSRIAGIVRAMREFSHPGAELELTDLRRLIENTVVISRNEWKYCCQLHAEFDPALPAVPCHAGDLKQVILNLIVNAAHAIEQAGGTADDGKSEIRISAAARDGWVWIEVSDSGCGMTPEIQNRIFEPFFTTKQVGQGTGQGLSISHAIVTKKHRGSINVKSAPGQGTTFIIRLPLDQPFPEE